jgi:hypothetical protein
MKIGVSIINRNDGYKDFKRGIVVFKSMLETFDEVNYVDWNSPHGSYLWEIQDSIPKTGKIKHYVISSDVVSQLISDPNASKCNQALSRNIAIRRSQADWIVSTNIDIIPPKREDLINLIQTLDDNTFYTISRRELPFTLFDKYSIDQWEELRNEASATIPERYFPTKVTPNDNYSLINSCGDFQLASKKVWDKIRGFEESMIYALFEDSNIQKKAKVYGCGLEVLYNPPLFHIEHGAYSVDKEGKRVKSEKFHESTTTNMYNDAWRWIEDFSETENGEDWGLGNTEIEFETI